MNKSLNSFGLILCLFLSNSLLGQLISSDPIFFSSEEATTILFNAALGNEGLAGFEGDIYAHIGVITEESTSATDWKYVKTAWGENVEATLLESLGDDLYQLPIGPSIREYFAVPEGEDILQIALVFRSDVAQEGGGYLEGKDVGGTDIYLDVYQGGSEVVIVQPGNNFTVVEPGTTVVVSGEVSETADITFLVNDEIVELVPLSNTFAFTYSFPNSGETYTMEVVAETASGTATSTVSYYVTGESQIEEVPVGINNGVNYLDENTAILNIYAPGKENVYLIGEFNDWGLNEDFNMKKSPDGNNFWVQVNDLIPGQEYAYQFLFDGSLNIADPYSEKVLDFWNDPYIPEAAYPNLKEYPFDTNEGIVSVLQTAQEEYEWTVTDFERPAETDLVIVEVLLRDLFDDENRNFQSLIDTLPYYAAMGINAIELMPVNEFGGNLSWGYNPSFMFAVDKYYGTKNKFKELIDKCHEMGMAVIMDIVLNHQTEENPIVQMYPLTNNPWCNQFAAHDFNVFIDLDFGSQETIDYARDVIKFWIEEYNIDGYRFDLSKGFIQNGGDFYGYDAYRIQLWKDFHDYMQDLSPGFYGILEHLGNGDEERELANYGLMFWGKMNDNYDEAAMGYNNNSNLNFISHKVRNWNEPKLIGYFESHDEERMMFKNLSFGNSGPGNYSVKNLDIALERCKAAAAFFFTVPGPKMIYEFGELGFDYSINDCGNGSINDNCRTSVKPLVWDYLEEENRVKLKEVYSALINLRTTEPAFQTTDFDMDAAGAMKRITLRHNSMDVNVLGNFDVNDGSITGNFPQTGMWYDYLTGESLMVNGESQDVFLKAGEFRVYTTKQLETPGEDLTNPNVFVEELSIDEMSFVTAPNPATDLVNLSFTLKEDAVVKAKVFDQNGKLVKTFEQQNRAVGINNMQWDCQEMPAGNYYLFLDAGNARVSAKIVVVK